MFWKFSKPKIETQQHLLIIERQGKYEVYMSQKALDLCCIHKSDVVDVGKGWFRVVFHPKSTPFFLRDSILVMASHFMRCFKN